MMYKNLLFLIVSILPFLSCTKEGGANQASGSGKGGSLARFAIANGRLFVAEDYQIQVFDVTNAALPVHKKSVYRAVNTKLETLFSYKNNLFV